MRLVATAAADANVAPGRLYLLQRGHSTQSQPRTLGTCAAASTVLTERRTSRRNLPVRLAERRLD